MNLITCAPEERNVAGKRRDTDLFFAPLERGEPYGRRAFYKHLAPNGAKGTKILLNVQLTFAQLKCFINLTQL
jgi:hypothetical protein